MEGMTWFWIIAVIGGGILFIVLRSFTWWYFGIYEAFDRMDKTNKLLKEISKKLGAEEKEKKQLKPPPPPL